jgi:hypothetical protein
MGDRRYAAHEDEFDMGAGDLLKVIAEVGQDSASAVFMAFLASSMNRIMWRKEDEYAPEFGSPLAKVDSAAAINRRSPDPSKTALEPMSLDRNAREDFLSR